MTDDRDGPAGEESDATTDGADGATTETDGADGATTETGRVRETGDPVTVAELSVPGDGPQYDCAYCDRVFARERHRDLHRGRAHPDRVGESAAAAYRAAVESEWESLVRYRYVALGTLVLLYFGFLVAFAVVGV